MYKTNLRKELSYNISDELYKPSYNDIKIYKELYYEYHIYSLILN